MRKAILLLAILIIPEMAFCFDLDECQEKPLSDDKIKNIVDSYRSFHGQTMAELSNNETWAVVRNRCHYSYFERRENPAASLISYLVSPQGVVVDAKGFYKTHGCAIEERNKIKFSERRLSLLLQKSRRMYSDIPLEPEGVKYVSVEDKIGCFFSYSEAEKKNGEWVGYIYQFDYLGNFVNFYKLR